MASLGQLLVGVVVREVVLLILGEGLALHCREVAAEALDVYAHALFGMGDDGCEAGAVGDADLHGTVLKIGFAVVVMSEIEFLGKHLVEKCPYGQFLLAPCGAFGDFELLELIAGNGGAQPAQVVFVLGDLPYAYLRPVF